MLWKNIHHLPVENKKGELCGLLTWSHLERYKNEIGHTEGLLVSEIMTKDLITVRPETTIKKRTGFNEKKFYRMCSGNP